MNASRAKRRLMKWYRYIDTTKSQASNRQHKPWHRAHVKAYSDYMYAGRYAPNGIREPWVPTSAPGGA